MKIVSMTLPADKFYNEICEKTQIALHHSVSDPKSPSGDVNSYRTNPNHIATPYIIGYDGTITKTFPSNCWANHLGVKAEFLRSKGIKNFGQQNQILNKQSIAIELDAWGGLTCDVKGNYVNAYGKLIAEDLEVVNIPHRGYEYFQKYSAKQIAALEELLKELMSYYKIPSYGIKDGNFGVRMDALEGTAGIFSHTSFRADKSDLYPDPDLIQMLNRL
jgi:N-acetyl-anhydromuramyl-L-alanine amidase AmpD